MAWNIPSYPPPGYLVTADFWGKQITDNALILKTCIDNNGHPKMPWRICSSPQTLLVTDEIVFVDTTLVNVPLFLPAAASCDGHLIRVKWHTGVNVCSVTGLGGELIDLSAATFTFDLLMQEQDFFCNGTSWWLM